MMIRELLKTMQAIAVNLQSHKVHIMNNRINFKSLSSNLDILIDVCKNDADLGDLLCSAAGLKEFLLRKEVDRTSFACILESLSLIMGKIDDWKNKAEDKAYTNSHLKELSSGADSFYLMISELHPKHIRTLSSVPINLAVLKDLPTEKLIAGITGYRLYAPFDNPFYPGSLIQLTSGESHAFELYKRYSEGKLRGDSLVLVKQHF